MIPKQSQLLQPVWKIRLLYLQKKSPPYGEALSNEEVIEDNEEAAEVEEEDHHLQHHPDHPVMVLTPELKATAISVGSPDTWQRTAVKRKRPKLRAEAEVNEVVEVRGEYTLWTNKETNMNNTKMNRKKKKTRKVDFIPTLELFI